MNTKTIEIRDAMTCIAALAVQLEPTNEADRWLLARAGYGKQPKDQRNHILLMNLAGGNGAFNCDPDEWSIWTNARTFPIVHKYLLENWDRISSGDVVDVQFILGETTQPKASDRFYVFPD